MQQLFPLDLKDGGSFLPMTKCESQVLMCASIAFATAASRNQGNSDHHRNKYPHNDASSDAVCQDLGEMQKNSA